MERKPSEETHFGGGHFGGGHCSGDHSSGDTARPEEAGWEDEQAAPASTELDGPPEPLDYRLEVIRSAKRRKYVAYQLVDGVLRVRIPDWMSAEEEKLAVGDAIAVTRRKYQSAHVDLAERARSLAHKHDLPLPVSIRWSSARSRWGSCVGARGRILISDRLAGFPPWVLDYVIVHELAHLVVRHHGPDFWALVQRYPLAERAEGYLLAASQGRAELCRP